MHPSVHVPGVHVSTVIAHHACMLSCAAVAAGDGSYVCVVDIGAGKTETIKGATKIAQYFWEKRKLPAHGKSGPVAAVSPCSITGRQFQQLQVIYALIVTPVCVSLVPPTTHRQV